MNFGSQSLKQKETSWNATCSERERLAVRREVRTHLLVMFFLYLSERFSRSYSFSNALNIQMHKYEPENAAAFVLSLRIHGGGHGQEKYREPGPEPVGEGHARTPTSGSPGV